MMINKKVLLAYGVPLLHRWGVLALLEALGVSLTWALVPVRVQSKKL
jgi:hypothetical protein